MSISGISSSTGIYQTSQTNPFAKIKEDFDNLGKALNSGNLSDAKAAFNQLQKDSPTKTGNDENPMSTDIAAMGKALDSGDTKTAQDTYSKIQDKMSRGPQAGGPVGGGRKPGGAKPSDSGSSTSTIYDKKDTNKDGTVSIEEEMAYALKNSETKTTTPDTTESDFSSNTAAGGIINTTV